MEVYQKQLLLQKDQHHQQVKLCIYSMMHHLRIDFFINNKYPIVNLPGLLAVESNPKLAE